jgi:hypothetical protein
LVFDDGKKGIVDFYKFLDKGGVFEKLRNLEYFKNFSVSTELGVLTWYGEVDIAPEVLYYEATGAALPEWVERWIRDRSKTGEHHEYDHKNLP